MLTVVTCNFNHGPFLETAIESVLNQNFPILEYLLIDDGSTDNSRQIMDLYATRVPWIKLHYHPQNKGVLYSINEALSLAKGKYIHFLSADDLILKDFFRISVDLLEANPDVALCCSHSCFFQNHPSEIIMSKDFEIGDEIRIFSPEEVQSLIRNTKFWISGSSILRLKLAKKYGFDHRIEAFNDWFLYQQMALLHGVAYVPRVFYANRQSNSSYAGSIWRDKKKRDHSFFHLVNAVINHENKVFRLLFRKSGALYFYGKKMFWFLLRHPRFWRFIPDLIWKKWIHLWNR